MPVDTKKMSGSFVEPPENAPREVSQPLSDATIADQLAQARRNEKTLAPLAPQGTPTNAAQDLLAAAQARVAEKRASNAPAEGVQYRPAESETDSPARGVPTPIQDPNRRITGGWGDADAAQYNPLNGLELAELVKQLLDELNDRLSRDLRFHLAIVYPRASVTLTLKVEGYAQDSNFEIKGQKVHDKTPEAIAEKAGSPTAFDVEVSRAEFDAEGTAQDPPDKIRHELGLEVPRKQWTGDGANRQVVDLPGRGPLF